jgi:hypothetical protein
MGYNKLFKRVSNNQQFSYFAQVMVALFVNIGVCYIQEFKTAYHSDLQQYLLVLLK